MLHIAKRGLLRLPYWNACNAGSMIHLAQCVPFVFKYSTHDEHDHETDQPKTGDEEVPVSKDNKEQPERAERVEGRAAEAEAEDQKRHFPLLGGGLEKIQGGIREETFFNDRTKEMIDKIRKEGRKNKDDYESDEYWNEYKKSLETSDHRTSSSLSKHKNALEEMYFLSEQLDTLRLLAERMRGLAKEKYGSEQPEEHNVDDENLNLDTLISSDGMGDGNKSETSIEKGNSIQHEDPQ